MLNQFQKLNPKLFDKKVEMVTMRKGFGEGLFLAGLENSDVVSLCADLAESTHMHLFRDKFPERFFEMGVAEQNMASVASGLSAMGKIPVMASYAVFSPGRNWEQIRTTICYNDRHVIIIGSHGGVTVGADGGSHQALEDIALTRVLPRMTVISPCDAVESAKAITEAIDLDGPVYIRLSRDKTPVITTDDTPFEIGKANIFFEPQSKELKDSEGKGVQAEVGIIATGELVYQALLSAKELEKENITVKVLNISTIKPLDTEAVLKLAEETGALVTVEDHQVAGGLGSAVAECLAEHSPTPIEFVAVRDQFGQSGTPKELLEYYGLDKKGIISAVKKVLQRK